MTDDPVSDRILTIPNVISFARIGGVAVFWWVLLVEESVELAAVLIFVVGSTDWLDGYLARRLNQVSKLGKALDPVADRLMIASAVIGGLITGVIPPIIGYPLIAREVFMAGVTLYALSNGAGTLAVREAGKRATFLIYGAVPSFYLAEAGFAPWLFAPSAWLTGVVGLVLYWFVAFQYVGDARRSVAELESTPDLEES